MNSQTEIHLTRIIDLAARLTPLVAARHPFATRLMTELEILHERDVAPHFAEEMAERRAAAVAAREKQEAEENSGPGAILKRLIKSVTGAEPEPNCPCRARIRQMNAWGWMGCWKHRETIYQWMSDEAQKRGHQIESPASFFVAAWRELRREEPPAA